VAVSDRNTATRSQKKAFLRMLIVNAFFAHLGCLLLEYIVQSPPKMAGMLIFLEENPRNLSLKTAFSFGFSSKKIERTIKDLLGNLVF
jgi:hypothetical protein